MAERVWLVLVHEWEYETDKIVAVCASREIAERWILEHPMRGPIIGDPWGKYDITEHEVLSGEGI